ASRWTRPRAECAADAIHRGMGGHREPVPAEHMVAGQPTLTVRQRPPARRGRATGRERQGCARRAQFLRIWGRVDRTAAGDRRSARYDERLLKSDATQYPWNPDTI